MSHLDLSSALDVLRALSRKQTVGALIDQTMATLQECLGGELVSFNEMDLAQGTATVSLRPYREQQRAAVAELNRDLREQPMFTWHTAQPDWSPVRLSDLVDDEKLTASRLYRDVLRHVGGEHAILLSVTPPTDERWMYFMANRSATDFSDAELAFAHVLQPGLVALFAKHAHEHEYQPAGRVPAALTSRELTVLRHLASGETAERISHELAISPHTVRKHLEHLYRKLGTTDRLGAVIQGRDLGLLRDDEVSRVFRWDVRV